MLVTLTQFRKLALDSNGNICPMGSERINCMKRTSAGAFSALSPDCRFVRLATDTAIQLEIDGGGAPSNGELFNAGVEFLSVRGGETMTIGTVS